MSLFPIIQSAFHDLPDFTQIYPTMPVFAYFCPFLPLRRMPYLTDTPPDTPPDTPRVQL